jgi:short-subunit dehydrogenase
MPPIPRSSEKPNPTAALAKGNSAIITGGASGIGLAIAHECRKKGMKVGIVDRNVDLLDRAKNDLAYNSPEEVDIYDVDVSNPEDWKKLATDVQQRFGKIDFLVLNAGIGGKGDWGDEEYFNRVRALPRL